MEQVPAPVIGPISAGYRLRDYDLGSVTPEQVVSLLRGVRTGRMEDADRLYECMFETWPRLLKNAEEVSKAVSRLDWCVTAHAEKGKEPTPEAQAHADVVEAALWGTKVNAAEWETDFIGCIKAILDAYAKGHTVQIIDWHFSGGIMCPRAYRTLPAKFWRYPQTSQDSMPDRLMWNQSGLSGGPLTEFTQDAFIIAKWVRGTEHPIKAGVLRSMAKYYMAAYFGPGWLLQYAQLFGIPWRTMEADGSAAIQASIEALQNLGAAGWGVLPKGTTLTIHDAVKGGESLPQKTIIDMADEACDLMFLGQTLTSTQGDRGSQALGTVHSNMRDDALEGAKDWVAGELNNQLVPAIIRLNFGAEAAAGPMPRIMAKMPETRDVVADLTEVKGWKEVGLVVSKQQVYDKLQVSQPAPGDDIFEWPKAEPIGGDMGGDEEQDNDAEPVEAARKGTRGKTQGGLRPKLWRR